MKRGHRRKPAIGLKYEDLIFLYKVPSTDGKIYAVPSDNKFDIEFKMGTIEELQDYLYVTDEYLDGKMDFVWESKANNMKAGRLK